MKKNFLLFVMCLFLIPVSVKAQEGFGIGVSGGTSIPVGDFNEIYNTGYLGKLSIIYQVSNIQFSIQSGYGSWGFDNEAFNRIGQEQAFTETYDIDAPINSVPLIFHLKYFFFDLEKLKPYFAFEGGLQFLSQTISGTITDNGMTIAVEEETFSSSETYIGLGAGFLFNLEKNIAIDFNAIYGVINDSEFISDVNETATFDNTSVAARTSSTVNIIAGINYFFD